MNDGKRKKGKGKREGERGGEGGRRTFTAVTTGLWPWLREGNRFICLYAFNVFLFLRYTPTMRMDSILTDVATCLSFDSAAIITEIKVDFSNLVLAD